MSTRLPKFVFAAAMAMTSGLGLAAVPQGAMADNLHGYCLGLPASDCQDNQSITPIITTNSPNFGFSPAGHLGTGTFYLDILLPNNLTAPGSITVNAQGGTQFSSATGSNMGDWTTGKLKDFLGRTAQDPNNPIGAWLGLTQAFQASATGYHVYDLNFGTVNYNNINPTFASPFGLPEGTVITAFFCTSTPRHTQTCYGTPNSAALMIEHGGNNVPEPMTLSLFGAGLLGMGALSRRRKARKSA